MGPFKTSNIKNIKANRGIELKLIISQYQLRGARRAKRAIRQIRHTALRDEFGDRCRLNAAAAGGAPGSRAGQMASSTGSICPL